MIRGSTRVFALLGDPVSHSLSPPMHNAAFLALGIDAVYVAVRTRSSEVAGLIRGLSAAGGGGNITVPHKALAAGWVSGLDPALPAANTFWGEGDVVLGANTDPDGVLAGWEGLGRPAGDWLVLGTGGSALAAVRAGATAGVGIAVRSRSAERAAALGQAATTLGARPADPTRVGLVINCTPLGLDPTDPLPMPVASMPAGAAGLDLVYRPGGTPWTRGLSSAGHPAHDGRRVLLGQGVAAFRCWFPAIAPPVEVMGAAIDAALR